MFLVEFLTRKSIDVAKQELQERGFIPIALTKRSVFAVVPTSDVEMPGYVTLDYGRVKGNPALSPREKLFHVEDVSAPDAERHGRIVAEAECGGLFVIAATDCDDGLMLADTVA